MPPVPTLGRVCYVRDGLRAAAASVGIIGVSPAEAMQTCKLFEHPCSRQVRLDPLLQRCLVAARSPAALAAWRMQRFAHWRDAARAADLKRSSWLEALPRHCRDVYGASRFNGPLFQMMFEHLRSFGYPDARLWEDICNGFPTGVLLKPTGLWPPHPDKVAVCAAAVDASQLFESAPRRISQWRRTRKRDDHYEAILQRNLDEVKRRRRREIKPSDLIPGQYVAHPEFMVMQGTKGRACDDCSASGWTGATVPSEKVSQPGTEDPVDYASRLLTQDMACEPTLAVADEDSAYRNWPNGWPEAMVMLLFDGSGSFRAWRDFALSFGDRAAVNAYNRIRVFLTTFFRVEFAMAVWSYFDDSAIVEPRAQAPLVWNIFLAVHSLLRIPLKGDPSNPASVALAGSKFQPPSAKATFLGELCSVSSLPCSVSPTSTRKKNGKALIDEALATDHIPDPASVFGKLRFLGSELHGKCGIPALQPLLQCDQARTSLSPALRSGLQWLRVLLDAAGPREWHWGTGGAATAHIFGDASEPDRITSGLRPMIGGVLIREGAQPRAFEAAIPAELVDLLPKRKKHIYFFELLWPCAAAFVWRDELSGGRSVFYDDNEGARHSLLGGFSSSFAPSLILALFWGAAAVQRSSPWIARVSSGSNPADALTKPGMPREHFAGAQFEPCTCLDDFWIFLLRHLRASSFPDWSGFASVFGSPFQ